jgi:hypothetical protein
VVLNVPEADFSTSEDGVTERKTAGEQPSAIKPHVTTFKARAGEPDVCAIDGSGEVECVGQESGPMEVHVTTGEMYAREVGAVKHCAGEPEIVPAPADRAEAWSQVIADHPRDRVADGLLAVTVSGQG